MGASGALAHSVDLADVLARGDIWRGDALAELPESAIPSGYSALDAELPGGGWPRACLSEFFADRQGFGEMSLLLPALAALSGAGGWIALVAPPWLAHAPAWAAGGVAPGRLLIVRPGRDAAWSVEQLIKSGGFAAVLAWLEGADDNRALRRLQVAAEGHSVFVALWRAGSRSAQPSPAPLRLALAAEGDGVAVRIFKRRGRPAAPTVHLPFGPLLSRPGRWPRVVAGAPLSPLAGRIPAAQPVA